MSKSSCLNIIKRQAKIFAKAQAIRLSFAQEQTAIQCGFANFHELTTVAKRYPRESRLMIAALGTSDLRDVIHEANIYSTLEDQIEDAMAGTIAETNAYEFTIEDLEVTDCDYDDNTGALTLDITFQYAGEQDPDSVYHGSTFYVDARVRLWRPGSQWEMAEDGELDILACESDVDRGHRMEVDQVAF